MPSAFVFGFGNVSLLQGKGFFPSMELEVTIYAFSEPNSIALSINVFITTK